MKLANRSPKPRSSQRGLSLVELMIGLALSLLILSAVAYVFAGSSASYRQQESSSTVQESGRIALEVLNRDIRMAGNPGCGNVAFLNHASPAQFSNDLAITGAPGATAADPDAITVTRGSAQFAVIATSPAANQIQLVDITPLGTVVAGDRLLISDCTSTEVMTVTNVAGNTVTGNAMGQQFNPGAQVMLLETIVFTVAGGELMRNGQAVAGAVNNLKFSYGISDGTGRSATRYESAPSAADLLNAVAVKLTLTLSSGQGQAQASQSFTSTVALRNRAP